jgi:hypothetical protein
MPAGPLGTENPHLRHAKEPLTEESAIEDSAPREDADEDAATAGPRPTDENRSRALAGLRVQAWLLFLFVLFVVVHGVLNAVASASPSSFTAIGRFTHGSWWNVVVLVALVWIPLIGTFVYAARARAGDGRRTPLGVASGVVAAGFIAWHVWGTSAQRALGRSSLSDLYYELASSLSSTAWAVPVVSLGMLLGTAAVTTFLACSALEIWSQLAPKSSRKQQRKAWIALAGCAVYLVLAGTIVEYAAGGLVP